MRIRLQLGIKYREQVAGVGAIFPPSIFAISIATAAISAIRPLLLRAGGRGFSRLLPSRYYGVITIRQRRLIDPLYGRSPDALDHIARENPVEMLETYDVKPGQLQMFVAYVGRDEFNLDAQIDSFLYLARGRGLTVSSAFMPEGHHTVAWAKKLTPNLIAWMATQLEGHGPIEIKNSPPPAKAP